MLDWALNVGLGFELESVSLLESGNVCDGDDVSVGNVVRQRTNALASRVGTRAPMRSNPKSTVFTRHITGCFYTPHYKLILCFYTPPLQTVSTRHITDCFYTPHYKLVLCFYTPPLKTDFARHITGCFYTPHYIRLQRRYGRYIFLRNRN